MEWLSQMIEQIVRSQIWRYVANRFGWVDWVTLAFLFLGLIRGARHGFLRMLVKIAEVLLIAYVTFLYYMKTSDLLRIYVSFLPAKALPITTYAVIALPLAFLIHILDKKCSQWFSTNLSGAIKGIGGALAGMIYALFLWSFISQPLILTPIRHLAKSYEKGISISGPTVSTLMPKLYQKIKH